MYRNVAKIILSKKHGKERSELLTDILDHLSEGIQIISDDWRYLYLNDAAVRHSAYNRNELIGKTMMEIYPGIEDTAMFGALRDCMGGGVERQMENKFVFPDGSVGWFRLNIQPIPEGIVVLSVDVTIHKKIEESLRKSRGNYKRVVENISDAIVIDDTEGNIIFANRQFLELTGLRRDELDDLVWEDYIAPEYHADLRAHLEQMKVHDEDKFICEGIRKDGSRRWFEIIFTRVGDNGHTRGIQSAIRDITGHRDNLEMLKSSEAEKTRLLDELSSRYNELMQFNYIVSHNLRSPIANIIGLCEIMNFPDTTDVERLQILTHINTATKNMDSLVKDLNTILSLARPLNERKERCSLMAVLESIFSTLEKQINDSEIMIHEDIPASCRTITTICSYLTSILYNLVSNAIKYKSPHRPPEINISARRSNGTLIITVSDNGIGIDLDRHGEYIFGLYKRFNYEVEGKGLGLHMTKFQVEALGGSISVASEVGEGTTFSVSLPVN
jgi:PAS domain S-box-containing protein